MKNEISWSVDSLKAAMGVTGPKIQCPRRIGTILSHRTDRRNKLVCQQWCKTWGCLACKELLRQRYALHLAGRLLCVEGPVYEIRCDGRDYEATKKHCQRYGVRWVQFDTTADGGVILADSDCDGRATAVHDVDSAIVRLGQLVNDLCLSREDGGRCRPLTMCREWRMPKKDSAYRREGFIKQRDGEKVAEFFKAHGLRFRKTVPEVGTSWAVVFTMPDDPTAELIDGLKSVLLPSVSSASNCLFWENTRKAPDDTPPQKTLPASLLATTHSP